MHNQNQEINKETPSKLYFSNVNWKELRKDIFNVYKAKGWIDENGKTITTE